MSAELDEFSVSCAIFIGSTEIVLSALICIIRDDDFQQYLMDDSFTIFHADNLFLPILFAKNFWVNAVNVVICSLLVYGLVKRKHWLLLPWLLKEALLVSVFFIMSLLIFGFILYMTTDMTFRRIGIKEYDGSYLFFTIITYTLVLLIADVLSVCFWVEIYNLYDTMKRYKRNERNDIEMASFNPVQI